MTATGSERFSSRVLVPGLRADLIDRTVGVSFDQHGTQRTNGLIQIRSETAPALSYRLQASSNSLAWTTIFSTNLSVTGAVVYLDPSFTNTPQRLYKLVPGP